MAVAVSERRGLLDLPWGRVFFRDEGPTDDQRPLVLLHGLFVTHYTFRHLISAFKRHRRVIVLDLPGCGSSDRPRPWDADDYRFAWLASSVDAVLERMGVTKADVLGQDLGALVAIDLAASTARVDRLMLVSPLCFAAPLPVFERISSIPGVGRAFFVRLFRKPELRWYLRKSLAVPESLDETALCVYWDHLGRAGGREAAWAMLMQLDRLEYMRDRLPNVPCETLVVWGDDDRFVSLSAAERVVTLAPHARLETVEGCGHAISEERPDALAELVSAFCQG